MGDLRWLENPDRTKIRDPWPVRFITRADAVPGACDLDGDGRLDIVSAAEEGSMDLRWWRNEALGAPGGRPSR